MANDIKLNDLQKLALHYLNASLHLNVSAISRLDIISSQHAMRHIELAESILGEEVISLLKDPAERDSIICQATEFREMMVPENFGFGDFMKEE